MMGQALAEAPDTLTSKISDMDSAVFDATTNKLKLPEVHYVDSEGNMTSRMFAAELDVSKNVEGENLEFKLTDLKEMDDHGCVLPETWHSEMGHCMDQN